MCGPKPFSALERLISEQREVESLRRFGEEQKRKADDAAKKKHLSDVAFVNQNGRGK